MRLPQSLRSFAMTVREWVGKKAMTIQLYLLPRYDITEAVTLANDERT